MNFMYMKCTKIKLFLGWYLCIIERGDGEAGGEDPELPDRPAGGHRQVEADPWRRDGGPPYLHRQTQETYPLWSNSALFACLLVEYFSKK